MGTTISTAMVIGDSFVTGQVGDSRIYRVRQNEAVQLTEDHTLIAWQMKQGLISEEEAKNSPPPKRHHARRRNREYVEVDTNIYPLASGDRYILCSDGLHGYLQIDEIPPSLRSAASLRSSSSSSSRTTAAGATTSAASWSSSLTADPADERVAVSLPPT